MPLPSYLQVDYKSSKLLPLRYLARKAIIFSKKDLQFEMNQISQTALHYQTLKTVIINVRSLPRLSVARGGLRNVNNYKRLYRGIFPWLECLYFRTQKLVKTFAKTCSQKLSMDRPHYSHYSYFIAKLFPGFFSFFSHEFIQTSLQVVYALCPSITYLLGDTKHRRISLSPSSFRENAFPV